MYVRFANDRNCIRWHVSRNDANTYKLSASGFNNQPVQIMGKAVFDEAIEQGLLVKEAA